MKKLLLLIFGAFFLACSTEAVPEDPVMQCNCNYVVTRSILESTYYQDGTGENRWLEKDNVLTNNPDPNPDCSMDREIKTDFIAPGTVLQEDGSRIATETWIYYTYECEQVQVN
jgi:hypothetical protein